MAKGRNLPLKILGIILGTLLGLVLLVLVACQVFFHSSALKNAAQKLLSAQVDGTVSIGDVRLSPFRQFPDVSLSVEDLLITYPHDRFAPLAAEGEEGRGAEVDTLLYAVHLYAGADAKAFLLEKRLLVHKLFLDRPLAFARRYDDTTANWQVLRFLTPKDSLKEPSSFDLADIRLEELSVSKPRIVYSDRPRDLQAKVVWNKFLADGSFVPRTDSSAIDARFSLRELELGTLLETLGHSLSPALAALSTDGRLSMDARIAGPLRLDSLAALPPFQLSLDLPKSTWSWKGFFDGADLQLTAQGENTEANIKNVTVDDFVFHLDGLDLSAAGGARDLLGKDPLYKVDAKGSADLKKAVGYLPRSLRSAFTASGKVDLDLDGTIRQSQLSLYKCSGADLKGRLAGDVIRVEDKRDTIACYLRRPVVNLGTMASAVDAKDRAIAATATADSIDFDLGSSLCARGRNILVFAQNSTKAISAGSKWHPLIGKITADQLVVRGADSLIVGMHTTQNKFTVTPQVQEDQVTPYMRLESDNSRMFFKNSAALLAAKDASFLASAQVQLRSKAARDTTRRRWRVSVDSTGVPDFLREKDFRASDISFQVSQSVSKLLREWNPALQLSSSEGLFASPAFPLRSRFSGLSASLKDDKIQVDSVRITSGTSDLSLSGTVEGLKRGLTAGRTMLRINANAFSDRFNLNEIIAAFDKGKTEERPAAAGENEPVQIDALAYDRQVAVDSIVVEEVPERFNLFVVPANVMGDVHLNVGHLDYSTTVLEDFQVDASMQQRCIRLDGARARTDMGSFDLDAFYSTKTKRDLAVGFGLKLSDVTAEKVIDFFPKIDEVVPMLKSFKGKLDCEMAATTQIDTNMNFLLPTLDGMFKIHGQQLVLEDLGSLKKIAKTLMFKDQMTGRVDEMSVNGVISDNTLEVFPFILAIDRYTVALQGVQRLNKSFDYHVSLIKSPILLKLGINIFGPSFDAWKFRLGKPKYRTTAVPLFNEEVDNMQLNLVSSIKNVFTKGVDRVLQESHEAQAVIADRKRAVSYDSSTEELLTPQEQNELERIMMEQELEEETAALNEEIDKIIEGML
ncbi:MAG: hypothetical protein IJ654_02305 [Bacteroidales bacterium]|nr:hypothetical protein [Bacteroidales bacterium]